MSRRRLPVDIVEVKRLAEAGYTRQQIAAETGFTYGQIRYVTRRNEIHVARDLYKGGSEESLFWKANARRFKALIKAGATAAEAATKLGTTKNACISKAKRSNLTWRDSPIWKPPSFRDRRKTLGVTLTDFALYSAVRVPTIRALERNEPVKAAAQIRVTIALVALEAGCKPDFARAAALAAAPLKTGAGVVFEVEPPRRPDTEILPAGCFSAHNLALPRANYGKINRPATHVERAGTLA